MYARSTRTIKYIAILVFFTCTRLKKTIIFLFSDVVVAPVVGRICSQRRCASSNIIIKITCSSLTLIKTAAGQTIRIRKLIMTTSHLFRESFTFGHKGLIHWFPSHMARSMKKMQASMRKVDCVIEVHDARLPFAGRNPAFSERFGIKPRLLILNKKDLADMSKSNDIRIRLQEEEGIQHVMFTNCSQQNSPSAKRVIPTVVDIIEGSERFNRFEDQEYSIMVVGIPNVGKSSLINALRRMNIRKGKATKVGKMPGVTRALMQRILVSEQPRVWLLDTPGIMTPHIQNVEVGMKLAMMGTLQDHMVGGDMIADYILYTLNRMEKHQYADVYSLPEPCDDIDSVLRDIAKKHGKTHRIKTYEGSRMAVLNLDAAASIFIRDFRNGVLGRLSLD